MESKYRKIAFTIYAICILGFISLTIVNQNKVFHEGTAYKFRCEPVDPTDPFRGKYVRLSFQEIRIEHSAINQPESPYYGLLETDDNGFTVINQLIQNPTSDQSYIELDLNQRESNYSIYTLPIDRLYMNEDKAQEAENLYRNALRDSTQNVYAKVYVSAGRHILDDVYVDDVRLKDIIE